MCITAQRLFDADIREEHSYTSYEHLKSHSNAARLLTYGTVLHGMPYPEGYVHIKIPLQIYFTIYGL